MSWQYYIGLVAGVGVGNMLIYRFLWQRSWFDSIGIGLTAGAICAVLAFVAFKVFK